MDKVSFDDYLENRYKKQMEYYSKNAVKNQKGIRNFNGHLSFYQPSLCISGT
jgi:hypothetical protein